MGKAQDFASLMEGSSPGTDRTSRRLRKGEQVQGTVVQVGADTIFIDVGTTADARLDRSSLDGTAEATVAVGDRIVAKVVDARPDGPVLAVNLGRGAPVDAEALTLARETGTPVEGTVTQAVKGGLDVVLGGRAHAFCPASQVDTSWVESLDAYVGQTLSFRVVEVRDNGRSVVVSRRAVLEEQLRERERELISELVPGAEIEGAICSIGRHGVMVDLGGVEGFVHISELAPYRVANIEDVAQIGDQVRAKILSVDQTDRGLRIKLSVKQALLEQMSPPQPNEVLKGTIVASNSGGLIVATPRGDGFIPVRELELAPGADHRRAFPVGQSVAVVSVGASSGGRLRLSARQVAVVSERANFAEYTSAGRRGSAGQSSLGSLGELLRRKLGLPELPPEESERESDSSQGATAGGQRHHTTVTATSGSQQGDRHDPTGVVRRQRPR